MGLQFWRTFSAYTASAMGDAFYAVAVPLVLLQLGYAAATTTFLRTAVMATTVIAGFVVGYVVDKYAPGRLLALSYGSSAAVLVIVAAAVAAGLDAYVLVLAAAVVLGLFAAVSATAVDAGVPSLVDGPERVRHAYSLLETARAAASVLGPALAGLVASARSVALVVGVNAVAFASSAVLAGTGGARREEDGARTAKFTVAQLFRGIGEIATNPLLRIGITLSLAINICFGADDLLVIVRLVQEMSLPVTTTSLVMAGAGLTSIVISYGLTRYARKWHARRAMLYSAILVGLFGLCEGLAPNPWLLAIAYCATIAVTISYTVQWRSYRQSVVPAEVLGRVSSTSRSLAFSGVVAGTALIGVLQLSGVSAAAILTIAGVICTLAVAGIALTLSYVTRTSAVLAGGGEDAT